MVYPLRYSLVWRNSMAESNRSKDILLCPNCMEIGEHVVGDYKTRKLSGHLFDAELPDGQALSQTSEKFKRHALINCAGEVTRSCVVDFARQEILDVESPLSKLFSKRIRAKKCPNCGMLTKLSRLP